MNYKDTTENRKSLDEFLQSESPREREELIELWDQVADAEPDCELDEERSAMVLQTIMKATRESEAAPVRLKLVSPVIRWTAAVAAVIVISFTIWYLVVPIYHTAPVGERLVVSLPDGSTVELNSGSEISYSRNFGNARFVNLEGEAFFDVVHGEDPFIVETFNSQTKVLGTTFNVRAWEQSIKPATVVSLVTGSIELTYKNGSDKSILSPGQSMTVNVDGSVEDLTGSTVVDAIAWRDGNLLYKDELLGVMIEDVERRFNVTILLSVNDLHSRKINLSMHRPENVEAVIESICGAYSLNYRATSTGFEIFEADSSESSR